MSVHFSRHDPIRERYYGSLKVADEISDYLFYVIAFLSFVPFVADRTSHETMYCIVQWLLLLFAIGLFALGLLIRLYLSPRAEEMRRRDLISQAHNLSLTHERTEGYYNNGEVQPDRFLAAVVLENTFHSKAILAEMAKAERFKCLGYLAILFSLMYYQFSDLAIVTTAAVAVFSEQLISRCARVEWLRVKCEEIYKSLYGVFQVASDGEKLSAYSLEALATYETAKSSAGIVLSEKIFMKKRDALAKEWDQIRAVLGIKSVAEKH